MTRAMRGPALRAFSICPACCDVSPSGTACPTCSPPASIQRRPTAPPPLPIVYNPPVPKLRLRRVGVRVGLVVGRPIRLLDVEGVVLRVPGDLLDLALVDLRDELVVVGRLMARARTDQSRGEKRQHDDDQNRKGSAAEETSHVSPFARECAEYAPRGLRRGYQRSSGCPAGFAAVPGRRRGRRSWPTLGRLPGAMLRPWPPGEPPSSPLSPSPSRLRSPHPRAPARDTWASPAAKARRRARRSPGARSSKVDQLRFSPDGRSLYAAADEAGGALLRFTLRRKLDTLRLAQCLTSSPHRGCNQVPQLDGLSHIALTGGWVYGVATGGGGTLVRFRAKKG